jgi:hypothetical protein
VLRRTLEASGKCYGGRNECDAQLCSGGVHVCRWREAGRGKAGCWYREHLEGLSFWVAGDAACSDKHPQHVPGE